MSDTSRPPADEVSERKEQYLAKVSHVQMGLAPKNFEEGLRMAELLAKSTLVPNEFRGNPGNVLIAIQMGMEIGLPPMQALQSIAVINGRPSLWGDGMLALVQSSPVFEWIDEPPVANGVATCTVKRKGWPNPVSRTFTLDDAKKAGLWNKTGPWQQYPDRMLRMRARAYALRDVFADVLRGLASAEEMLDVTAQGTVEARVDPEVAMRNDLACSPEQWEQIKALWDELKIPGAQRILQAKQYAGNAVVLAQKLLDMTEPLPPAPTIDPAPLTKVTKHAQKRLARAKTEAGASPAPDPEVEKAKDESIAEALGTNEPTCDRGTPITEPCDRCIAEADDLATTPPPPAPKAETAAEYAARRKRELAELQQSLDKPPF